jgi:hypothetical protein
MVADGLSRQGFRVTLPDDPDDRELTIANLPGIRSCRLHVGDGGDVEWDYPTPEGREPDPKRVADIVTAVLTGDAGPHERLSNSEGTARITFKGIVGLELKTRGFTVGLDVYEDYVAFTVAADIFVTPTGTRGASLVRVNDDGVVMWMNDYWPRHGTSGCEPPYDHRLSGKDTIAREIVETVTRAVRVAYGQWPALAGKGASDERQK